MAKEVDGQLNIPEVEIDTLTAIGPSTPICFAATDVCLQVDGPATAVTVQVQRSVRKPDGSDGQGGAAWAPVDVAVSGNPSAGLAPVKYSEPGVAWWRANVTALTGASVGVSLSGKGV